jgi:hypothetical protein
MPEEFDFDRSNFLAHLIDGHRLAQQEGLGDLQDFYWTSLAEAKRTGTWSGTALKLWLALFAAHRAIRHGGHEPQGDDRCRLDHLCETLRDSLTRHVPH